MSGSRSGPGRSGPAQIGPGGLTRAVAGIQHLPPNTPHRWSALKGSASLVGGSFGRRMGHSASNFFSGAYDRLMGNSAGDNALAAAEAGNVAAGMLATAASAAAAAGCTAAFTAAMAGPQAGVTLGIIGLALLAKEAYSNREAAHDAIQPHVWSIVDNVQPASVPSFDQLKQLAAACLTLQEDGKNQFGLIQTKYNDRYIQYVQHIKSITAQIDRRNTLNFNARNGRTPLRTVERQRMLGAALEADQEAKRLIDQGQKRGGDIWEFVRRCSHISNYIQASEIVALAVRTEMLTGGSVDPSFFTTDYFARSRFADARKIFFATDEIFKRHGR